MLLLNLHTYATNYSMKICMWQQMSIHINMHAKIHNITGRNANCFKIKQIISHLNLIDVVRENSGLNKLCQKAQMINNFHIYILFPVFPIKAIGPLKSCSNRLFLLPYTLIRSKVLRSSSRLHVWAG